MLGTSAVTTKGQVTIPLSIRSYLGIKAGSRVYFEVDPQVGQVKIKKSSVSSLDKVAGSLRSEVGYVSLDKVREEVAKDITTYYAKKAK